MKAKIKLIALVVVIGLFLAQVSFAQTGLVTCGRAGNECKLEDLISLIIRFINLFLGFSWLVAMFFMFWGGWGMVTAWGNEEKLKNAKATFRDAVIGFFFVLIAFLLVNFVVLALSGYSLDPNAPKNIYQFIPYPRP